jgi:hypothetical protein
MIGKTDAAISYHYDAMVVSVADPNYTYDYRRGFSVVRTAELLKPVCVQDKTLRRRM